MPRPKAFGPGIAVALALAATAGTPVARAQGPTAPAAPAPVVVPPRLSSDATVPYPDGATGDATVTLLLTIEADGSVGSAIPSEVHEPFSSAASRAALSWRFDAATRDNKPMSSRILFEVVFHAPGPALPPAPPEPPEPATPPKTAAGAATPAPKPKAPQVQEITVAGERAEPSRSATLSRTEVRQIPGTFGDPFRAIEILPGVTPIVSGLPFFFVRGAPPGNVGYFLDGVRVPLLFHVGAGPSVIHPALIDRVDLYPGGYPARYGRFAGGIVAGETVAPDPELHGEYNVRLFDAGALAETGFDHGRGTVLVGGRYSYTAALLSYFSPNTSLDYWDYQGRATYDVTPDDRLGVFAFGSYDHLGQKQPDGTDLTVFGTEFHRVDLRWDHRIGTEGKLRLAVTGGLDRSEADQDRSTRDRMLGTRAEYSYQLSKNALFRAGTDLQLDTYDVVLNNGTLSPSAQAIANLFPSRTDLAFGTRADVILGITPGFEVTPGMRVDFYSSEGTTAIGLDPRLAARTTVSRRVKLLTALGVATQPPAFVVPVPGFQPGGIHGGLQKAYQESTGLEVEFGQGMLGTATVFHNAFYDMSDPLGATQQTVSGCKPGTYPPDTLAGDRATQPTGNGGNCGVARFPPGTIGPDRSGGGGQASDSTGSQRAQTAFEVRSRGEAYGLELLLKRKLTSRLGGFFSYTLSRSTRSANGKDYTATFDRTHVLNAAAAYDLGKNWRAGTRVTFYTGLPRAPDPTTSDTRLSPFFRLDLRLEKRWQLGQRTWISFVAEWMNATLSKESVSTTCTLQGCQETTIGPVTIPSLGVEGGF